MALVSATKWAFIFVKTDLRRCNLVNMERRKALKTGAGLGLMGVLAALGLMPAAAWSAVDRAAFGATNLKDALNALGVIAPADNASIKLTAPDIAENGATVPVTVECMFSGVEQISILVDKNPTMLVASFAIPEGTEGYISTKIKMAQTATVVALVKANGKFYRASREVQVTSGGCS